MNKTASCLPQTKITYVVAVRNLRAGQTAYVVPWAFDPDSKIISLDHHACQEQEGRYEMMIKCIHPLELYYVWPLSSYGYERCAKEPRTARAVERTASPPQKKCLVKFTRDTEKSFYVWTNLSGHELKQIPGISLACEYYTGRFNILVDARYDLDEVQAEIERRAIDKKHCR